MFGGHRFLFGDEGSYRFSAPDFSGPSAKDHESLEPSAPLSNSIGERSPPHNYIKPVESGGLVEIFNKIAFGSSNGSIDSTNLMQSKEVFADPSDGVTYPNSRIALIPHAIRCA